MTSWTRPRSAAADLDRAKADPTLSSLLQVFPRSGTRFVICDTTNPPTDNPLVRQALSLAIDRKTLADKILKSVFTATQVMLPPDIPGYNPGSALGEDVAKAKALLAEAGFPDGAGFPQLTMIYTATDAIEKTCSQYSAKPPGSRTWASTSSSRRWRTMRGRTGSTRSRPRRSTSTSAYGDSDWGDPANWHNQLFASSADFYHAHWKNEEFDTLVNDARGLPDAERRVAMYEQAEAILNQDAAFIPLHNLNRIYVIKPYVKGIYHYPILGPPGSSTSRSRSTDREGPSKGRDAASAQRRAVDKAAMSGHRRVDRLGRAFLDLGHHRRCARQHARADRVEIVFVERLVEHVA